MPAVETQPVPGINMAVGGMGGLMSSQCAKWAVLVLGNVSQAVRPEVSAAAELHVGTQPNCGELSCS